ncbi:MAG: adenylate/guanylate cyclase domain-containing protein [Nitrospinae bacterium]|nr:adenylate/guanylate cyclase domain-containing protein [Nitrospinota bacterium]
MQPSGGNLPEQPPRADEAPRPLKPEGNSYTADEIASLCLGFRERMRTLVNEHPELALVDDEFKLVLTHAADPLKELDHLLTACARVFVGLKHLLNPVGLPLRMTEDGRVLTQQFKDVATFVTDIRGSTELTEDVAKQWGVTVFEVLSDCYFLHVTEVLEKYECHYLNYTGDGLLVLSRERKDAAGRVVLPSLDNAVLCAIDLTGITNCIAEAWRQLGLIQENGVWHETGLGLTSGDVEVGDPFIPDRAPTGKCAEFDRLFRALVAERVPHFQPRTDYSQRIRAIHALSPAINRATRLEGADITAPDHTCMMIASDVAKLCPPLRERFQPVGIRTLKGIGQVEIFGVRRYEQVDVPALENACRAHYASQVT